MAGLAVITLFTTLPFAHRARDYYNINNHSFGGRKFTAEIQVGSLYVIYLQALGLFVLGILVIGSILGGVMASAMMGHPGIAATFKPGSHAPLPPFMFAVFFLLGAIYLLTFLFISTFVRTKTLNLALTSTVLEGGLAFESTLSPLAMTWLLASNLLVTLLTLGLMYPWAMVRQQRYIVDHIGVFGPTDLDGFTSTIASQRGAIGEEVAGFFDIDFGL